MFILSLLVVFFLLLSAISFVEIVEDEPLPLLATIFLIGAFAVFHFWTAQGTFTELLTYIKTQYPTLLLYVLIHVIAGIIWSFIRWFAFLKDEKARQEERYDDLPYDENRGPIKYNIPVTKEYKGNIIMWTILWELSLVGYIFNKPVRKLYKKIYKTFSGTYDRMTKSIFKEA